MGRPKAELRVGGQPILGYLIDRFRWEGPTLLVTAPGREGPRGSDRFTREVIDPVAGEGPLRGVLTAMEATETDLLLIATCDMPLLEAGQLAWLAEELSRRSQARLVMTTHDGQLEPLPLAIRSSAIAWLREHYTRGGRSIQSLAAADGSVVLGAPDDWPGKWRTNLNTPADLAAFLDQPDVP